MTQQTKSRSPQSLQKATFSFIAASLIFSPIREGHSSSS
jgi:hypothetical protein